jgi:ubiquinone/menaquinone biosynthesis C-methylase UbiE
VLDIGFGYGSTTGFIHGNGGFRCVGIDYADEEPAVARRLFPKCPFVRANCERLPFKESSFDTIILRDTLHHLYCENDFKIVKGEIARVARAKSRLILFDPNVTGMVRTLRKISFHEDFECSHTQAAEVLKEMGYKAVFSGFNTVMSLPLSGGYVGINFVPPVSILEDGILAIESGMEKILSITRLDRHLCWRYMIVGDRG